MPRDIQENILLVVSDTAMYRDGEHLLVFDPVLRELKAVEHMFSRIIWLGARTPEKKDSLKPVDSEKIEAEMMPCISRSGWMNILFVMAAYPVFFCRIMKYLSIATHVHTRAPSHPAALMILLSLTDRKRIYAHKYAGEWTDRNIPFTYRAQRSLLKRIRRPNIKVMISGKNEEEAANVHDMENPCIYESELQVMNETGRQKDFAGDIRLLFVGNLVPAKGITELLRAIDSDELHIKYKELYVAGGGKLVNDVKKAAQKIQRLKVYVMGDMSREELNKLYASAHIMILPSSSESFPKVVAEAAAFGCIPVTTSLSAITRKVNDGVNGFLMQGNHPVEIRTVLNKAAESDGLKQVSLQAIDMSSLFTYERFRQRMAKIYGFSRNI